MEEDGPQKSREMVFTPVHLWGDGGGRSPSGYCRVKPADEEDLLYDAGERFIEITQVYNEKLADLKSQIEQLQKGRVKAMFALARTSERYLKGVDVLYWARSKSKYVPAVIEGVRIDSERYYDTVDLYLKIRVMGTSRLVHVRDVCFSSEDLEQISRSEFLGE